MKLKTLFFVVGIAPTPEETSKILALAETGANVEVLSVEKMEADSPVNLHEVAAVAGSVPTNYADAFKAQGPAINASGEEPAPGLAGENTDWQGSATAKPNKRK